MYFFVNVTRLFSPDARFFLLKMHQIRFFAVIPPQTPLGELTALPKTLLAVFGKREEKREKEEDEKEGRGRGMVGSGEGKGERLEVRARGVCFVNPRRIDATAHVPSLPAM